MKKLLLWVCCLWTWLLIGCSSTAPTPDGEVRIDTGMEAFDKEAKSLIDNLDQEDIERLKGVWEAIQ